MLDSQSWLGGSRACDEAGHLVLRLSDTQVPLDAAQGLRTGVGAHRLDLAGAEGWEKGDTPAGS